MGWGHFSACALAAFLSACTVGTQIDQGVTGIRITVAYDTALGIDQLAFSALRQDGSPAFTPGVAPDPPELLTAGEDSIVILVSDSLGGETVVVSVVGTAAGVTVGVTSANVSVRTGQVVSVHVTLGAPPSCGDGTCDAGEDSCGCAADCGAGSCGDSTCCSGSGETSANCSSDCGGPTCGDGTCDANEDATSCPADCSGPVCNNGTCEATETACNCAGDCADSCGDGCCSGSEDSNSCAADCSVSCGDGTCGVGEDPSNCPADCADVCTDGLCTGSEDPSTCPADCPDVCGDSLCTGTENTTSCPADCSVCGDGSCTGSEDLASCPADCSVCGDGNCTGSEDIATCVVDCAVCGDGTCEGSEDACSCASDCGGPGGCGDGICCAGEGEDLLSCAVDCGNTAPIAADGTLTTDEDTTGFSTLVAVDAQGDPMTYTIVTQGTLGTATITNAATGDYDYVPANDDNGTDTFTFQAADAALNSNTATITVTITPVDDPPVLQPIANHVTYVDTPLRYVVFRADEGGGPDENPQTLTVTSVTSSDQTLLPDANITTAFTDIGPIGIGELTLTPAPGQTGTATVTVTVSDGGATASGSFDLQVLTGTSPPFAFNIGAATAQGTAVGLTLSAYDPTAGDPITGYTVVTQPVRGQLTGTAPNLTYTPRPTFSGQDAFTYTATDGEVSNVAVVTLVVDGSVLFVVANQGALSVSDGQVDTELQTLGYTVTLIDAAVSQTSDSAGKNLVVISASVGSGNVNIKFRDVPEPVLVWERFLWDDFEMSNGQAAPNAGTMLTDVVDIVFPEHPMAGGFSGTGIPVFAAPVNMVWNVPNVDADIIARNQNGDVVLFVYEPGDALYNGFTAQGKRVSFLLPDNGGGDLIVNGRALFRAAANAAIAR